MKVLHILETSTPHVVGYTIRANAIIENQRKLGVDVVAVTSPLFQAGASPSACDLYDGVKYYRTNHIRPPDTARTKAGSFLRRALMLLRYKRAILDIATREQVDVLHAHSSYLNAHAAGPAARQLGIPLVYEVRTLWGESAVVEDGWRSGSWKHRLIWRLELGAMTKADLVIPIAKGIRAALIERGIDPAKLSIVPNGVDTSRFAPIQRDNRLANSLGFQASFIAGFVGSMRKLEGLATLVEAQRICRDRGICLGVVIVGDGADKTFVEARARELGLSDIVFTGNVPHADVAAWYSIMDVVVYPRIRAVITERVTPLKPLEVMAMEKVCVGSDVGGLTELIDDGRTGLIFRSGDASHLADVLIKLKSNPLLMQRLGSAALEHVRTEREWLVIASKYLDIYKDLTDENRGSKHRIPA